MPVKKMTPTLLGLVAVCGMATGAFGAAEDKPSTPRLAIGPANGAGSAHESEYERAKQIFTAGMHYKCDRANCEKAMASISSLYPSLKLTQFGSEFQDPIDGRSVHLPLGVWQQRTLQRVNSNGDLEDCYPGTRIIVPYSLVIQEVFDLDANGDPLSADYEPPQMIPEIETIEDWDVADPAVNLEPDLNGNGVFDPGMEDADGDGFWDLGEDANCNGELDTEDANMNGMLDAGEDLNMNGMLDTEDLNGNDDLDTPDIGEETAEQFCNRNNLGDILLEEMVFELEEIQEIYDAMDIIEDVCGVTFVERAGDPGVPGFPSRSDQCFPNFDIDFDGDNAIGMGDRDSDGDGAFDAGIPWLQIRRSVPDCDGLLETFGGVYQPQAGGIPGGVVPEPWVIPNLAVHTSFPIYPSPAYNSGLRTDCHPLPATGSLVENHPWGIVVLGIFEPTPDDEPEEFDVDDRDGRIGVIIHELMHALSFQHEQTRSDRDEFVTVIYDNISIDDQDQFDLNVNSVNIGPYDFESIMHYGRFAFSLDGQPTIDVNFPYEDFGSLDGGTYEFTIGTGSRLSQGDIDALRQLYGPPVIDLCARTDLNGDGRINFSDLFLMLEYWANNDPRGDINGSGTTDIYDYLSFLIDLRNGGQSCITGDPRPTSPLNNTLIPQ